ncbi:MAG: hypothetical protein PVI90_07165, partial [Desulfobacteraceae bacterium]
TITYLSARPHQPDFHAVGYLYGLTFTLFMQVMFLAVILVAISYQYNTVDLFFESLAQSVKFFEKLP